MSLRHVVRAWPTLLRVGFLDAVAYRAEFFVWVLATTMPLIMMVMWTSVAADGPIGRYDGAGFVAYFLCSFIVRQLTGAWAAWQINFEVRSGTLAMRLLRPIHPIWAYAAENLGALPLRLLVALPVAVIALFSVGTGRLGHDPFQWMIFPLALLGGWMVTFLANCALGTLSLYMESSLKVMDVWISCFYVFSGYLVPVSLFPPMLRRALDWLPFRYQIGLPIELMTGAHSRGEAFRLLAQQWTYVAMLGGLVMLLWARGTKRFAAYGG